MADDATDYIYNVVSANSALQESFSNLNDELIRNINKSNTWTIVSRLTSGTGFWKISNKIRAVTNAWVLYNDTQAEAIKKSAEMGEALGKYHKLMKKIPQRGFSMEEGGPEDTDKFKKQRRKITKSDEYQGMMEFNKMKLEKGGFAGDADAEAKKQTMQYFEEQIAVQQDMRDSQLEMMIKEEQWKEEWGPLAGVAKKADQIMSIVKTLPKFLMIGLKVLKKVMLGMMIATLLLPIVFKVLRWLLKVASSGKNIERLKVAWGFVKEALMGVMQLAEAIFKGQIGKAIGIYVKKILFPLANLVIFAIVQLVKVFIFKPIQKFLSFLKSDEPWKRLTEILMGAMNRITGSVGGFVRGFLGVKRKQVSANDFWATSASGNFFPGGGTTWVGEGGPELLSLPRGARVHSNFASRGMQGGNTFHIHVNGRVGASDTEIQDIAKKVSMHINQQMNRTSSTVARF